MNLTKWRNAINEKLIQASARAYTMDKKTTALLSAVGILGMVGFSMAVDTGDPTNFVTCDGARKIALYSRPLALFFTVLIFFIGGAWAANDLFQKKYGHFAGVLIGTLIVVAFLYATSIAIGNYGQDLANALCSVTR